MLEEFPGMIGDRQENPNSVSGGLRSRRPERSYPKRPKRLDMGSGDLEA